MKRAPHPAFHAVLAASGAASARLPQLRARGPVPLPAQRITVQKLYTACRTLYTRLVSAQRAKVTGRRLRILETVQLGEKRFVSVLQLDGAEYLIGGAASQVVLLTKLREPDSQPTVAAEELL